MAKDPVCGMTVDEKKAAATATQDGKTYYFCSAGCKERRPMASETGRMPNDVDRSRIRLLTGGLAFAVIVTTGRHASVGAAALPAVMVYKSPT